MESICVDDVGGATEFLSQLLIASSSQVAGINIEHTVLRWENRQILVHGKDAQFLLNNNRLFLSVENVALFAERAVQLFAQCTATHFSSTSRPACLIHGPGGVEISALECGPTHNEDIYLSALRAASELQLAEEMNGSAAAASTATAQNYNPVGDQFRSLFPLLYDSNVFRPVNCNTSVPIPFKTDMFDGMVILLVNSTDDPSKKLDQTDWTFEVQVQGKFTRKLEGPLFIGAQISKKMELGMLTRAMCRTIMNFARSNLPLLHHSFGDSEDVELPHITGPLWNMSDRVVVTPKGEVPPVLGTGALPETDEARRTRRKCKSFDGITVDLDSTYSFSTSTANIELVEWSVVNIPLLSKIDLILCAYELKGSDKAMRHSQEDISYCFRLLLRHASNHHNLSHDTDADSKEKDGADVLQAKTNNRVMRDLADRGHGYEEIRTSIDFSFGDDDEPESSFVVEAAEDEAELQNYLRENVPQGSVSPINFEFVPVIFEVDDFRRKSSGARRIYYGIQFPAVVDISDSSVKMELGNHMTLHSYMECKNALCTLKVRSDKPNNYSRLDESSQRRLHLQALFSQLFDMLSNGKTAPSLQQKVISLFSDLKATKELLDPEKNISSEYGVSSRKHREGIGATLCHSRVCVQMGRFYWTEEYMLLTSTELVFVKPATRLGRTARVRIPLKDIFDVCLTPSHQRLFSSPFSDFSFITISSFSRKYNIAVRDHAVRDRWLSSFASIMSDRVSGQQSAVGALPLERPIARSMSESTAQMESDDPFYLQDMNMLSAPAGFNLGDRVVLNGRSLQANPFEVTSVDDEVIRASSHRRNSEPQSEFERLTFTKDSYAMDTAVRESSTELFPKSPDVPFIRDRRYILDIDVIAKIVAEALDLLLNICERMIIRDNDVTIADPAGSVAVWILFMDKVSALSNIEIDYCTYDPFGSAASAMFLNLYHTLLLHSFLAIRIPSSALNWPSMFNCCAYEAFGDIFSLSELEHGVIRHGMSKPSNFLAQMLIPKSSYSFALTANDMRLLWAINCGSSSLLESIPVYTKENLDSQLDYNIRLSLFTQFKYSTSDMSVTVPIICSWYTNDIVAEHAESRGNKFALLAALLPFLGPSEAEFVSLLLETPNSSFTLIYSPFEFRCRVLERQTYHIH